MPRVLVVDDEPKMARVLEIMLVDMGHEVLVAADGRTALTHAQADAIDLVITDLRMPEMDGVQLLSALRESGSEVPVIIMTAYGTVESAVAAMKQGAYDYILRPFDVEAVELVITRALSHQRVQRENAFLREELDKGWGEFVGRSPAMQAVYEQIRQVAAGQTSVFITGESGTGKELAARAIHQASPRRNALFVAINCAAIPLDMLESELFGHSKGAFTGAHKDRVGKFEFANGGTLFLDEIVEMTPTLQAKLLRALQEQTIERLGSNRAIPVDLRVIAATNRDVRQSITLGTLREDLFYRLNVFSLTMPPLRARPEDITLLVSYFLDKLSLKLGVQRPVVSDDVLVRLQAYAWPGNVRELSNVMERALVLSRGTQITVQHLPQEIVSDTSAHVPSPLLSVPTVAADRLSFTQAVADFEKALIARTLVETASNKTKAAHVLAISERTLWYKIKKYRLN